MSYIRYYKLLDVEFWEYEPDKFPVLRNDFCVSDKYIISENYTLDEMDKIEQHIIQYFENLGYDCSIMNPLYPDKGFTVISVDLYKSKKNDYFDIKNRPGCLSKDIILIFNLLNRHKKRLNYIFNNYGDISQNLYESFYISNDLILKNIETEIADKVYRNLDDILKYIKSNSSDMLLLLHSLRWSNKNSLVLDVLFDTLLSSRRSDEINLILLQFIPLLHTKYLSNKDLLRLKNILLDKTIKFPCSAVRNKTLSLLSMLDDLQISDKATINFIKLISRTKQYNCSYPAKQIIKTL